MTKATKIIAIIITASALWLGSTAYISSNTKSYLNTYVEQSNTMYKANGIEMNVEEFEKGFFTSNAKIKIDFTEPKLRELIVKSIKLPIEVDYELENGPLFFNNGLGFGSSRVHSRVDFSEHVVDKEAFIKIFKDDIVFTSSTSIDFFSNAVFFAQSNKILLNVEGDEVHVSPLTIEGDMNMENFQGQMKFFVASVTGKNNTGNIDIKDMVLDADISKFYDNGFYLGDFILELGSITMKDESLPFALKDVKIVIDMNIDENEDKTIDMKFKLQGDVGESQLPKDYASLNKVEFSYSLNGVKLESFLAFQDFTNEIEVKEKEILVRLKTASGELDMGALAELEKLRIQTQDDLMMLLVGLLQKDSTNFDAEIKMIDKQAKESRLKMNIGYVGDEVLPTSPRALEEKLRKDLLKLITINLDVDLNKEYIRNLPIQLQQELAGQLQMGAIFGIIKENNNSYSFEVDYKPKELMINGQNRSELIQMLEIGLAE